MALFRSMGPKGIQSNLFIWWQSEEKGHTAMSAGPQQAQALLLQMALKKKGIVYSPHFVQTVLLPMFSFSQTVATKSFFFIPCGFLALFLNVISEQS